MPYLGDIGRTLPVPLVREFPLYARPSLAARFYYGGGTITGVASNAAGPNARIRVSLHWSTTNKCLAQTWTDWNGRYTFRNLFYDAAAKYNLYCDSPRGSPVYRPLAHGNVVPDS